MSPDDHYRKAEELLAKLDRLADQAEKAGVEPVLWPEYLAAEASSKERIHAHATLSLCQHPVITKEFFRRKVSQ